MTSGGGWWRDTAIMQDGHDVLVREIEDDLQRAVRCVDEECGVHHDLFGSIAGRREVEAPGGFRENVVVAEGRYLKRVECARLTSHLVEESFSLGQDGDEIGRPDGFCSMRGSHYEVVGELGEELGGIDGIASVLVFLKEGFDNVALGWHRGSF
jgi:hypothetical protein